jgi:predicted nucleic acid-binding protein
VLPRGKYVGAQAEIDIAEALATGDMNQIETGADDLIRMAEHMRWHAGFPLNVADASVIAATERLKALSTDLRP